MAADALDRVLDALDAGDADAALRLGTQALQAAPDDASLWSACGIAARLGERPADAERCWRRALALQPDALATHHLANLLLAQGRDAEALACYQAAADAGCADARCWVGLGVLLAGGRRLDDAEAAYRSAMALQPDDVAALTNLGLVLEQLRRLDEAEACQRRALALAPELADLHNHLAGVLARRPDGHHEAEAERHYREALRLAPQDARHLSNLGALFYDLGRVQEAEQVLRAAVAQAPGLASAQINLGHLLLSMGRLPEGLAHAAQSYALLPPSAVVPGFPTPPPPGAARQWTGQPLQGKRLLVWPEQGHGDQLQFCRYLQLVRAQHRPAQITYASTASLLGLMRSVAGADRHIALQDAPAALPAHDYWVPLQNLPLFCGTHLETIPAETPYLRPEPTDVARWAPRIPAAPLRVGLVWRGNPKHDNDAERSLPGLATLAPLWQVPGVAFVSLQKWAGEEEGQRPPPGQPLVHLGSDIGDFADSAAVLAQLDLLISVDTAGCHLAGALDRPCWVLLPAYRVDWRWLRGRDDTPWYPRTRLFRQGRRGDWAGVVHAVQQALADLRQGTPGAA
ncbi:tetratricopeptide repeat-containing glycosyltransferase family protein [Pseudorhodoferax sp.]|uniref:tetratricopeptide repeat-containing glycosyltransferase family protein n=1 Tax=Pseudorhodoferax sp. TaxID=1993553 RepID=UPI002DD6873D|nr:tetratricopeptide repeat-containing glycosyltransferase family protein [Pseudorhodoferax sp.]